MILSAVRTADAEGCLSLFAGRLTDEETLETAVQRAADPTTPAEPLTHRLVLFLIHAVNKNNHARTEPSRVLGDGDSPPEIQGNRTRQVANGQVAGREHGKLTQQHVAGAVTAEEVGYWGDFEGLLVGERALKGVFAGGGDGGGLEGFATEKALVDDVVAVAEDGSFVGGWR